MALVQTTSTHSELQKLAEDTFQQLGGHVIMGAPIGVGKAPNLLNAFYSAAKQNPDYKLVIHTALILTRPGIKSDFERRLLEPFFNRQFDGLDTVEFAEDAKKQNLPRNVEVVQFYFKAGDMLNNQSAQRHALSVNYTQVADAVMSRGVNLVTQGIAVKETANNMRYSLSSNPDMTLDLQKRMRDQSSLDGKKRILIAEINKDLPFMPNDAEIDADFFDIIVKHDRQRSTLFAVPQQPISTTDHSIGLYASTLIKDGGTLQVGIGSLGDAIANALIIRHNKNNDYKALLKNNNALEKFPIIHQIGGIEPFNDGLYGNTEMLVPGYLELKKGGVLKRKVYNDLAIQTLVNKGLPEKAISLQWFDELLDQQKISSPMTQADVDYLQHWGLLSPNAQLINNRLTLASQSIIPDLSDAAFRDWLSKELIGSGLQHGTLVHGGFFVGNQQFYQTLRDMPEQELQEINMTSVDFTNQMKGNEALKTAQRRHARFMNACMKTTLSGASVSDALENGQMVSGVGGQFDFVSMGHHIPEARSILLMRASRHKGGKPISNIVFNYGHITVPRHMRDIVVTEYGIADLRNKTDEEVIIELIKIADSRFQQDLITKAKKAGKLHNHFQLPIEFQNNTSQSLKKTFTNDLLEDFSPFPFGKELTDQEVCIGAALKQLLVKASSPWQLISPLLRPIGRSKLASNQSILERMQLDQPKSLKEHIMRKLLLSQL